MSAYYYLVASLPTLASGTPPALTPERFRALCSEHLAPADLAELDAVLAGAGRSAFARAWQAADGQLRNACARLRAARHEVEPDAFVKAVPGLDLSLARRAQDAMSAPDPRQRERQLDDVRRQVLSELAFDAPFGLEAVLAYGLGLALAWRWESRSDAAGREALTNQIEALLARHAGRAPTEA